MHSTLDLHKLADLVTSAYSEHVDSAVSDEEREGALETAFQAYMLLRQLLDYREDVAAAIVDSERAPKAFSSLHLSPHTQRYFEAHLARVEIVNASGELERVYFRFPSYCLLLTEESKQALLWGVDRDTPGKQVQEFLEAAEPLRMEMQRERELCKLRVWRLLMWHKSAALNSMFIISFPLNVLITHLHSAVEFSHDRFVREERLLMMLLGLAQLGACIAAFTMHTLQVVQVLQVLHR